MDMVEVGEEIGSGAFGVVYKATKKNNTNGYTDYVLKYIDVSNSPSLI